MTAPESGHFRLSRNPSFVQAKPGFLDSLKRQAPERACRFALFQFRLQGKRLRQIENRTL